MFRIAHHPALLLTETHYAGGILKLHELEGML